MRAKRSEAKTRAVPATTVADGVARPARPTSSARRVGRLVPPVTALGLVALAQGAAGSAPTSALASYVATDGLVTAQPGGLDVQDWPSESPEQQADQVGQLPGADLDLTALMQPFDVAARIEVAETDGRGHDVLAQRLLDAAAQPVNGKAAAPAAVAALKYALSQSGKPYVWGAAGPNSYDCSGLTQRSYRSAGVVIPRTSREQATVGTPIRIADLLPGDLLFYAYDTSNAATIHHVAMYAGDGLLVHAPQTGDVVHVSPMWLSGYIGAVRLVGAVDAGGLGSGTPTTSAAASASPTATPSWDASPSHSPTSTPSGTPSGTPTSTVPGAGGVPVVTLPPTTSPTTPPPVTTTPPPTTDEPTPTDPPTTDAPTDPPTSEDTPTPDPSTAVPELAPTSDAPTTTDAPPSAVATPSEG